MSETQALTTTHPEPATAVVRPATVAMTVQAAAASANARAVELLLRPPSGVTDPIVDGPLQGYSRRMVDTLKSCVAWGAPDEEVYRFILTAIRHNLDPLQKEIWCINMAGKDQDPQWQVIPSRDGLVRAARRNPGVKDVRAQPVRIDEEFWYDTESGECGHKVRVGKTKSPLLGAYCQVIMHDGRKYVDFFYVDDVRRDTKAWKNFEVQMCVAAIQRNVLKRYVGLSDLYIEDRAYDVLEDRSEYLLAPPPAEEYINGYAIGPALPERAEPTGIIPPSSNLDDDPDRGPQTNAREALNARMQALMPDVEGATSADVNDARRSWTAAIEMSPLSQQPASKIWDLVEKVGTDEGAGIIRRFIGLARDARIMRNGPWKKLYAVAESVMVDDPKGVLPNTVRLIIAARFDGKALHQVTDVEFEQLGEELRRPEQLDEFLQAVEEERAATVLPIGEATAELPCTDCGKPLSEQEAADVGKGFPQTCRACTDKALA
jgi:hypothetical protein